MKMNFLLGLMMSIFLVAGCTEIPSPRPVAVKFLEAMRAHDYVQAGKFGTKETVKLLKQLQRIEALQDSGVRTNMGVIRVVSEEIHGKNATVYFMEEGVPAEQKISLKRVDETDTFGNIKREWKVSLRKEELPLPVTEASANMPS